VEIVDRNFLKGINRRLEKAWFGGVRFDYWDGKFIRPVSKNYRVSICTTCMNRLEDVKLTLRQNIEDNADYGDVEFLLLDYNSADGLGDWVRAEMMSYVERGLLVYYRTEEPRFYTMAHSRNVAFKLATGDVVNNVDADNYTNKGFATYLNRLANERPERAIFAKGKRATHGRLGFFRNEFLTIINGYDESMFGYGHDEKDLMYRALCLGFRLMYFGGDYYRKTETKVNKAANYDPKSVSSNWRYSEQINKLVSYSKLLNGEYKANRGVEWGRARLVRNFSEEVEV
jgi:hypothetical protein